MKEIENSFFMDRNVIQHFSNAELECLLESSDQNLFMSFAYNIDFEFKNFPNEYC